MLLSVHWPDCIEAGRVGAADSNKEADQKEKKYNHHFTVLGAGQALETSVCQDSHIRASPVVQTSTNKLVVILISVGSQQEP